MVWSTSTADGDPGAGTLRADSATFGAVTRLYVDDLDSDGGDVAALLAGAKFRGEFEAYIRGEKQLHA